MTSFSAGHWGEEVAGSYGAQSLGSILKSRGSFPGVTEEKRELKKYEEKQSAGRRPEAMSIIQARNGGTLAWGSGPGNG